MYDHHGDDGMDTDKFDTVNLNCRVAPYAAVCAAHKERREEKRKEEKGREEKGREGEGARLFCVACVTCMLKCDVL